MWAYRAVRAASDRSPMGLAMGVACLKMSGADLCVQVAVEKRERLDWRRTLAFAMFGVVQIGVVQHSIFTRVMPRMFPAAHAFCGQPVHMKLRDSEGLAHCLRMTLVHELTVTPFMIFPAFYMSKEFIQGSGDASRALSKARDNALKDNFQSLKIFLPTNLVNFTLVPTRLRAPVATVAGSLWAMLLSMTRGASEDHGSTVDLSEPPRVMPSSL